MGAGIASEDGETKISARVVGQFSSTRSELVAIAIALWSMTHTQSLALWVDSAASTAALQRLAWCRSGDFCPSPRKIKDVDVMHDILSLTRVRHDEGHTTTLVKVYGHSGWILSTPLRTTLRYREQTRKSEMLSTQLPDQTAYYMNGPMKMIFAHTPGDLR
jgi:hypothetical protein